MKRHLSALKFSSIIMVVLLCTTLLAPAQTSTPTTAQAQAQPWKSIPIPPLPPFHPAQPKRIQLKNGAVIFLAEDHELPFINGFVEMKRKPL